MPASTPRRALPAVLALLLPLAGCGAAGDGSSLPPTTVFDTSAPALLGADPSTLPEITTTTSPEDVAALADALAQAAAASPIAPAAPKAGRVPPPPGSPRTAVVGSPSPSGASGGSGGSGGGGPTTTSPAATRLTARMTAGEVTPPPGDPGGSGSAALDVDRAAGQLCFDLTVRDLVAEPTGAHVHRGPRGAAGDVVVELPAPAAGTARGCLKVPVGVLADLEREPAAFFVDVHTRTHPNGAVRGQLARS